MSRGWLFALGLGAVPFLAAAAPAVGQQRIRGVVLDDKSRAPVPGVSIVLLDARQRHLTQPILSDSTGKFLLPLPKGGRYALEATRIGYVKTVTPQLDFEYNTEVRVELLLSSVQALVPIRITEKVKLLSPPLEEVEERRKNGLGFSYTRPQIAKLAVSTVSDLLRLIPGVSLIRTNGVTEVTFRRSGRPCIPDVYFDGTKMRPDTLLAARRMGIAPTTLDIISQWAYIEDIYGVEVYTGAAQTPGRFVGINSGCGVIAFWSTRGRG